MNIHQLNLFKMNYTLMCVVCCACYYTISLPFIPPAPHSILNPSVASAAVYSPRIPFRIHPTNIQQHGQLSTQNTDICYNSTCQHMWKIVHHLTGLFYVCTILYNINNISLYVQHISQEIISYKQYVGNAGLEPFLHYMVVERSQVCILLGTFINEH